MPLIFPPEKKAGIKSPFPRKKHFLLLVVLTNKNTSDEAERNLGLVGRRKVLILRKTEKGARMDGEGYEGRGRELKR